MAENHDAEGVPVRYRTKQEPTSLVDAVCFDGQPVDGWTIERVEHDRSGATYLHLVFDSTQNTARIRLGTYLVDDQWLTSDVFDARYEAV